MRDDDLLILKGSEVRQLLAGRELEVVQAVRATYEIHSRGESSLPHSTFLRFPGQEKNRIIALPAYLGDRFEIAGLKWIASFPAGRDQGLDRASAVVILNSTQTGRPQAIMEGSIISSWRTAASAVLAGRTLLDETRHLSRVGLIGCGLINYEIARFILKVFPEVEQLVLFDSHRAHADRFAKKCRDLSDVVEVVVMPDVSAVLASSLLVSMATTAIKPHLHDLSSCASGTTILHISLRDLAPEVILAGDNIVDDIDHVCREQTSIHLAEQLVGHKNFIRGTLGDILMGRPRANVSNSHNAIKIFSPFGLGVLDLALAKLVSDLARTHRVGTVMESFLPDSWISR